MSEYNNITSQLIDSFEKMVQADPFIFDPLHGCNIQIIIEPGTEIASHYNKNSGGKFPYLYGLHSTNQPTTGMSTIRVAKEVFKEGGDRRYIYKTMSGNMERLMPIDVLSHEFGHEIQYQILGRDIYFGQSQFEVESYAITQSNFFRGFYGRALEPIEGRGFSTTRKPKK